MLVSFLVFGQIFTFLMAEYLVSIGVDLLLIYSRLQLI